MMQFWQEFSNSQSMNDMQPPPSAPAAEHMVQWLMMADAAPTDTESPPDDARAREET